MYTYIYIYIERDRYVLSNGISVAGSNESSLVSGIVRRTDSLPVDARWKCPLY